MIVELTIVVAVEIPDDTPENVVNNLYVDNLDFAVIGEDSVPLKTAILDHATTTVTRQE